MARVLVDIGAHVGETLSVAMEPRWGFDRIYSFEPAPECWPVLERLADERVDVLRFGLWSSDTRLPLHDPGTVGASLFEGKEVGNETAEVELRDAAVWFAQHLADEDEIVVKVNCEGAECDILEHLLAAGQLAKVDELLVHFDVRKIPQQQHREAQTRARLDAAGIDYHLAERIFFGRNVDEKTVNWLHWYFSGPVSRLRYSVIRRIEFAARVAWFERGSRSRDGGGQ